MITSKTEILINDEILRKAMYEVFDGKCFYTGRDLEFKEIHIDHILPLSKGGKNMVENYVLSSRWINKRKSGKYSDGFGRVVQEVNKLIFVDAVVDTYNSMVDNKKIMEHHLQTKDFLNENGITSSIDRQRFMEFMRASKQYNAIKVKPIRTNGKRAKRNDLYYHIDDLKAGWKSWSGKQKI